ncbi:hypothetical protein BC643_3561 [Mangrovibacterium diazotrophicum]|uniref:Uncharacterized protein n=1 Tax=Mangrovibacterium diazotrophicum TaxID=1261403 RepID=A0A419VYW0_9BACT|nr:hypothetical protein BC643_3561 [Mangrovibacterium diazotrophicum]
MTETHLLEAKKGTATGAIPFSMFCEKLNLFRNVAVDTGSFSLAVNLFNQTL